MSTHDRLVSQLEGYMDDLVDCFEEFVKKSMVVISVVVGTLVLMVMYVIMLIFERTTRREISDDPPVVTECVNNGSQVSTQQLPETTANIHKPCKTTKSLINNYLLANTKTISLQVIPSTYPSFGHDESFMDEIDLNINSKMYDTCKQTQVSDDLKSARAEPKRMRRRMSCVTKNHLSSSRRCSKVIAMNLERNSCCSMCCEDDHCNKWK